MIKHDYIAQIYLYLKFLMLFDLDMWPRRLVVGRRGGWGCATGKRVQVLGRAYLCKNTHSSVCGQPN